MTKPETTSKLVEFDSAELVENFARRPMAVRHNLAEHPLLSLDRLAQLADSLPDDNVEHNLGDVPEILPEGEAPKLDATPGEIARGIESNGCWMVLKRANRDPEYHELLAEALADVIPVVAGAEGGATKMEAFIFLSAPNSTTPTHLDPEHNMLLQVKGSKEMIVGGFPEGFDAATEAERYFGGGHRNLHGLPSDAMSFQLTPGDGVYVPFLAPHVVHNGPTPSISFSITFNTEATERIANVHSVNARLRRLGITPAPPGRRRGSDWAKSGLWGGMRTGKRLVGRITPGG